MLTACFLHIFGITSDNIPWLKSYVLATKLFRWSDWIKVSFPNHINFPAEVRIWSHFSYISLKVHRICGSLVPCLRCVKWRILLRRVSLIKTIIILVCIPGLQITLPALWTCSCFIVHIVIHEFRKHPATKTVTLTWLWYTLDTWHNAWCFECYHCVTYSQQVC